MKTTTTILGLAVLGAALACFAGCDDKKKTESGTDASSAALSASAAPSASAAASASAAPAASASAAAAAADEDEGEDEEDYAQEVSKSIDDKNYESELDKLEKEIGK